MDQKQRYQAMHIAPFDQVNLPGLYFKFQRMIDERQRFFYAGCTLFFLFLLWGPSSIARQPVKHTRIVYLGNAAIKIVTYQYGNGKQFIHVHHNEQTAKRAALAYIKKHGGRLITLVHPGERNIRFVLRHQRYEFDPNRIFTDAGIKKTLRSESHYSPAARAEIKKLSQAIIRLLPKGKIIAVHNNQEYSMLFYYSGAPLAADARALQIRQGYSHRNFYVVTKKKAFVRLQRLRQNVVWQARNAKDDGSLSIYLAHREYVNVEAAHDAFHEQLRMLKLA